MATGDRLPLQAGHPIVDLKTGLLTRPWVIFFQELIHEVAGALRRPLAAGEVPWQAVMPVGYWTPITNGDPVSPEVLFDSAGDCIVGFVPTP